MPARRHAGRSGWTGRTDRNIRKPKRPMLDPKTVQNASELTLDGLIEYANSQNASDIFLKVGGRPGLRILGRIVKTPFPVLGPVDAERLAYEHLDAKQRDQ